MEQLMTCKDVAVRYHVKIETVWTWIREGKLKAAKFGRIYRIRPEDLKYFELPSKRTGI
ncbi:MAG: helix-turn-helix domain-containing protein [Oscillospiraceae bacterium]|jgi:excisionase family DNA binding protein|nr:helix-turn-helix domain-containing protein [Oscillospiraceae bacterium]